MDPCGRVLKKSKPLKGFPVYLGSEFVLLGDGDEIVVVDVNTNQELKRHRKIGGMFRGDTSSPFEFKASGDEMISVYRDGQMIQSWQTCNLTVDITGQVLLIKRDQTIQIWRWVPDANHFIFDIQFELDNTYVDASFANADILVSWGPRLSLWDTHTGRKIKDLPTDAFFSYTGGSIYALVSTGGRLQIRSVETTDVLATLNMNPDKIPKIFVGNNMIYIFQDDTTVQSWSLEDASVRPNMLVLVGNATNKCDTPLARFLVRDGDHAVLRRVIGWLVPYV
jgi:hypothetical protein